MEPKPEPTYRFRFGFLVFSVLLLVAFLFIFFIAFLVHHFIYVPKQDLISNTQILDGGSRHQGLFARTNPYREERGSSHRGLVAAEEEE